MKTFFKRLKNVAGFTLVELMVVVAIIGVLSAVAIPNFRKYQAKAKTSEAKLQLASIFTAETAFYADFEIYAHCLSYMGYNPSNESAQRYYATGISISIAAALASMGVSNGLTYAAGACDPAASAGNATFLATKPLGSTVNAQTAASLTIAVAPVESAFTAAAAGSIDKNFATATNGDLWTINELKKLSQVRVGY